MYLYAETSMYFRSTRPNSKPADWIVALAGVFWVLLPLGAVAEEDPKVLAREIYSELIAFPSTEAHGGSAEIAKYAAGRLIEAGFAEQDVQIMGPSPQAAGVLARFHGRGEREPVLVLAHLDVVEALPEDWSVPPFELIEKEGYFYGRGTADNKAGAAALLTNFIRLKREGFEPSRDYILMLTGDEETEMNSAAYFATEKRDLIDAAFALNSDGGTIEAHAGQPAAFVVEAAEKVYLTLRLEVTNPGGHSSRPRADNAIYELAEALLRLRAHQFPVSLNDATRRYFSQAAQFHEPEMAASMKALAEDRASEADIARLDSLVELRIVMRTTCVATQLDGGHAENALPQTAAAIVNCRILPQESPDEIIATVRRVVANDAVRVTVAYEAIASPPSPLRADVMDPVVQIAAEMFPGIPVITDMSAGATDGLHLRNAGIPTYGVSALSEDTDDHRAHGRDERVRTQAFYDSVEYWYRLLRAL
jgi:acetylornithine deacetylase/succinyl-diaminopimelate desuccinylase-like protein